eukprot:9396107-Pyramimonas_sp.AAC.1
MVALRANFSDLHWTPSPGAWSAPSTDPRNPCGAPQVCVCGVFVFDRALSVSWHGLLGRKMKNQTMLERDTK